MSSVVAEVGIGLVERFGGDVGKLLAAALGGGLGASGYKYLQPHFAGRGFDRSRSSARKTGINIGRNIATGLRLNETQFQPQTTFGTYRFRQKYGKSRHDRRKCKCVKHHTCSSRRSY